MDDQHDNINAEDLENMNGRDDSQNKAEETQVLSKLFALDQQPDPSPRFVAQLGQSLMPSAGRMTLLSATTSTENPTPDPQPVTGAIGGGKRRRPIMSFGSAAVLMVIVVLVGYAVTLWAVDNSDNPPANMAFASTFEVTSTAVVDGCVVEPKQLTDITRLVGYLVNGVPEDAVIVPPYVSPDTVTGTTPPAGEPADEITIERINSVYEQYTSCLNGRDYLRAYALFTDDGIARSLVPNGVIDTYRISQLSAVPQAGTMQRRFDGFERVEELPDGRVVAYPPGEEIPENYVIFKEVDGHWLIDDLFESHG